MSVCVAEWQRRGWSDPVTVANRERLLLFIQRRGFKGVSSRLSLCREYRGVYNMMYTGKQRGNNDYYGENTTRFGEGDGTGTCNSGEPAASVASRSREPPAAAQPLVRRYTSRLHLDFFTLRFSSLNSNVDLSKVA